MRAIPFRRVRTRHLFAMGTGVFWYFVEPLVFAIMHPEASVASHACSTMGLIATVYESTWRPRADDFIFNSSGQMMYEAHRRLRASKGKPEI